MKVHILWAPMTILGLCWGLSACKEIKEESTELKANSGGLMPISLPSTTVGIDKVSAVGITKEADDGRINFNLAKNLRTRFPAIVPYIAPDNKVLVFSSDQVNVQKKAFAKKLKLPASALNFKTERLRAETNLTVEVNEKKLTGVAKWWMDLWVLEQFVARKPTDNTAVAKASVGIANGAGGTTEAKAIFDFVLVGKTLMKEEDKASVKTRYSKSFASKKSLNIPVASVPLFGLPKLGFTSQMSFTFVISVKGDLDVGFPSGVVASFIPAVSAGVKMSALKFEAAKFAMAANGVVTLIKAAYPLGFAFGGSSDMAKKKPATWSSMVLKTPKTS